MGASPGARRPGCSPSSATRSGARSRPTHVPQFVGRHVGANVEPPQATVAAVKWDGGAGCCRSMTAFSSTQWCRPQRSPSGPPESLGRPPAWGPGRAGGVGLAGDVRQGRHSASPGQQRPGQQPERKRKIICAIPPETGKRWGGLRLGLKSTSEAPLCHLQDGIYDSSPSRAVTVMRARASVQSTASWTRRSRAAKGARPMWAEGRWVRLYKGAGFTYHHFKNLHYTHTHPRMVQQVNS